MDTRERTARAERLALVETLRQVGPGAPTLCEGWSTRDLAAHLVVREHRPDAMPGIALPALAAYTARVQQREARRDWAELLRRVADGPAPFHPATVPAVDEAMNAAEMFVHHEDVLRAQPGWAPRTPPAALERRLWATLRRLGPVLYRRAGAGVVLHAPGHGRVSARRPGEGQSTVVLAGAPGELLLHAFGRDAVAQLTITGDDAAVEALARSPRGL